MSTSKTQRSTWRQAWTVVRTLWNANHATPDIESELATLSAQVSAPCFWLFGKTQSGKSSIIRYLTGAEDAEIGNGFRPCTLASREYVFPNREAHLVTFLDTRGVDEPGYDPTEDIAALDDKAHLMIVTSRVRDFSHGGIREALTKIRQTNPSRPVVLALTCLHELDPQAQHAQPYPFDPLALGKGQPPAHTAAVSDELHRLIAEQTQYFEGLVDRVVPIDLTRPDEGYTDVAYGGEVLKRVLIESLPDAYRTCFARLAEVTEHLSDWHLKHAIPVILGYSTLAAAAGALPIPFLDLLILPTIQARMIHALGRVYQQPATAGRFLEAAASLGIGLIARQAVRQVAKIIPYVGSVAGAAVAGATTYATGRAFCEYVQAVHEGHVPTADTLRRVYAEQLHKAERAWFKTG